MRTGALAVVLLLLFNPRLGGTRAPRPLVALDVSASWLRAADSQAWRQARERAHGLGGDSVLLVGSTLRAGAPPAAPTDTSALLMEAAQRAQLVGRPLWLLSDGESDHAADAFTTRLPTGSRAEVFTPERRGDIAITALQSPGAAVAGDTVTLAVQLGSGGPTLPAAELTVYVDERSVARRTLAPLESWETRTAGATFALPAGPAAARLLVVVNATGDGEPRNDSAFRTMRRGQRMTALAVSAAPDFDFREIVRVLRGALSVPTAARYRVARDRWVDENGRAIGESQVRAELGRAQIVVLHGDTAYFGPPRNVAAGALALIPLPADDTEWYLISAPRSPLSHLLARLQFDSLPPVALGLLARTGTPLLEARGPGQRTRTVATLEDGERRIAVIPIGGTARWALRGGVTADAFATLWGGIFAALAERPGAGFAISAPELAPRELHPQEPVFGSGPLGEGRAPLNRDPVRASAWPYLLIVLLLCTEWVLRRRAGLR